MIYLKKANMEDAKKEYEAVISIPEEENGFHNGDYNVTYEEFVNIVLPRMIASSDGVPSKPGYVPDTTYFLWDDDVIVGMYRIRHYLNDFLRKEAVHVGACILKDYRGKGYGTKGLELIVKECESVIQEDEIYMSCFKDNVASLKMQQKNGAYIAGENDTHYLTRIKIREKEKRM